MCPRIKNQEPQIILLSAAKLYKVLEVSTRFMRDHFWHMINKEQQAMEVIHRFYISIKREEWKPATWTRRGDT